MNHTYSLIWNPATQTYVPAPESARRATKGRFRKLVLALAVSAACGVQAAPEGGAVVDGSASIAQLGDTTNIDQSSHAVTINWQGFDLDADETVNFYQPDSSSLALNRVLSGDGTQIHGRLNANGRVFILDANGVLFGETAQVNVGSLVASSLSLRSADGQHFEFSGNGSSTAVTNLGSITAADGGAVALLGGQVSNQGIIRARLGSVALAAGNEITLDFAGDGLLNVQIDQAAAQALAYNGGLIQANGGSVLMTAQASNALLQTVVNNQGIIEAQTLEEREGQILLLGGFNGGTVQVGGLLDASAPNGGDGGFVETSGAIVKIQSDLRVTTHAPGGKTGMWLIDPTDIEVSYEGVNDDLSHASTQALQNSLATTNVTVETQAAGAEPGNITILDPIFWASGNSLTLDAHNEIFFGNYIHAPNGGLTLDAGGTITTGAEGHINVDSFTLTAGNWTQSFANLPIFMADDFVLNGGTFTRALGGNGAGAPWQITDIYGLQGLATTPNGNAVLVNDIDASGTAGWNAGAGFQPIAYEATFNGAGYEVDGLFINRPGSGAVGLFSILGAPSSVSGLGLTNVNVTGELFVGGLAGLGLGDIQGSYVTGSVATVTNVAGGLVGYSDGGSITSSYSTASVSGGDSLGGLVGLHMGATGMISDSFATGSVTGNGNVGGLIGWTGIGGSTVRSYASGEVTGIGVVGGLVGVVENGGSVIDSYWDGFTSGQGALGVGANNGVFAATEVNGNWGGAPDAYNELTYGAFDFTTTWFIAEGSSRPMLRAFLDGNNISNLYQLQGMSANLAGNYVLTGDIDASASAASVLAGNGGDFSDIWGGRGFAPVGTSGSEFTGTLDGADFVIDGLTINRTDLTGVGLFGYTLGAILTNIGLINSDIAGEFSVGGLVGQNAGSIVQSYTSGTVTGTEWDVGGLVGYNDGGSITHSYSTSDVTGGDWSVGGLAGYNGGGSISQSYATGTVTGNNNYVGGLVGFNQGDISQSYATGQVTGITDVGGLVGRNGGNIDESYWDSYTTGMGATGVGFGAVGTAAAVNGEWGNGEDAYNQASYVGFDFGADWFIAEGHSRPMLRAFLDGGNISNLYQLQGMAANLAGSYTLTQNIDASASIASAAQGSLGNYSDVWGGLGFAPLGSAVEFTGSFNGNGFVIDNLMVDRTTANIGLFGVVGVGGTITNARITNAQVFGGDVVGGLAGVNGGTISQSYFMGIVAGNDVVGGLVGLNDATINRSFAEADVDGTNDVGGLVGVNESDIANSYASGDIGGTNQVGGLVGSQRGNLSQSFALGAANGTLNVGGLAGENTGAIVNSFWNTNAMATGVGDGNDGGATGLTLAGFTNLANFAAWGADIDDQGGTGAIWRIYEGQTAPLLRNFLTQITATAYDDAQVFDGDPYLGLHQINGTSGNGVLYGLNYAQFLAAFGEDGVPYTGPDILGSSDLEYIGTSQGAVNAGNYALTPSELWSTQLGYDIVMNDGELVINPLGINITVTVNDASKIYGNADPVFSWLLTQGAMAPGDTAQMNLSRQAGENVGNYTIFGVPVGDLNNGNYLVTVNEGVFTINPRPITLTVADASKIYGDMDPDFSWALTSGNLVFGQTLSGNFTRAPGENVGNYAITGTPTGAAASGNYAVTLVNGTLTITPRDIVIDISNLDKIYGEVDPEFTWAISQGSLVDGDELALSLVREPGENVGNYAITASEQQVNNNYSYTVNDGILTISPRPLVLTADNLMKIYGEEDPELTWQISNGTLLDGDTLMVSITRDDGSDVGIYAIRLSAEGDATTNNYALTFVDGQLQITPAPLTVTANDVTNYWDLLPAFTANVEGLVNGDTEAGVLSNLVVTSNLVLPLPGEYVLTPFASQIGNNYTINFVEGVLTLLSSNPGGNYLDALTGTQLPAREALGRELRANIFEGRPLLDGSEPGAELLILDGGVALDDEQLAAWGIRFPEIVRFPVNSWAVNDTYLPELRQFVNQLKRFPQVKVMVEGHTCTSGTLELNEKLSQNRADAVAKVLSDLGLEQERISAKGYDFQKPFADNRTPEGRSLNRRSEILEDEGR